MSTGAGPHRRKLLLGLFLAALVAAVAGEVHRRGDAVPIGAEPVSEEPSQQARTLAGRPAAPPDESWMRSARELMAAPAERPCGPYRLVADGPQERFQKLCVTLALEIEAFYVRTLAVEPVGDACGAIIAFDERRSFRQFVHRQTGLRAGYAAFTRASRGIVALPLDDDPVALAPTLAHELAHLIHRRAFRPHLPPWLAEGLADAVADSATDSGFSTLDTSPGPQHVVERVSAALDTGTGRPIAELLSLERRSFDREPGRVDYEQSALLVRFLLTDRHLGVPFRAYLADLAKDKRSAVDELLAALDLGAPELELRFRGWLGLPPS